MNEESMREGKLRMGLTRDTTLGELIDWLAALHTHYKDERGGMVDRIEITFAYRRMKLTGKVLYWAGNTGAHIAAFRTFPVSFTPFEVPPPTEVQLAPRESDKPK